MPVTLIVKAPNQQVEDQKIHCELNWTIRKLKGYLSEVYPSKPVSFYLVDFIFLSQCANCSIVNVFAYTLYVVFIF